MKKLILPMLLIFSILSCSTQKLSASEISIVNWNVQTFFDGNTDGTEYSNFKKNENWNKESYKTRLEKLCTAINDINADIFVFEEIENSGIVYDITNNLAKRSWILKDSWRYGTFFKNKKDAIGCAVISKFPITQVKTHNLDIRTESSLQPSMRPIGTVKIEAPDKPFILIVNHWKSKSGGKEKSEIWRAWQESVLVDQFIQNKDLPIIACGDFNRDILEFSPLSAEFKTENDNNIPNIELKTKTNKKNVSVFSPWILQDKSLVLPGSYYYNGDWERIDSFFLNNLIFIKEFNVLTNELWSSENNIPKRFKISNGEGFSDHLPIKCIFSTT